ncbi:protein kinase [Naegleria gruberi]|uniref:non-specific serine/threonine protein kinase n=1 Tax=Naegleria gruberi TaxID=5762 RepID=D2VE44_NAEGR|nr:protein kinase [Naegleria gruberi]EFC44730.1 protein kinase [Naegleria gruberi]|eukprot:XP_002677474.1 protein kinase [Naegleria gruberi]
MLIVKHEETISSHADDGSYSKSKQQKNMKFERCNMLGHASLVLFHLITLLLLLSNSNNKFIHGAVSWKQPDYRITTVNPLQVSTNPEGNKLYDFKTNAPYAIDFDAQDNMYILDYSKWVLKVNTSSGTIKTLMGVAVGTESDVDGVDGTTVPVGYFKDMSVNPKSGEVYLVGNMKLKKINTNGKISNYNVNNFDVTNIYGDGGMAINSKVSDNVESVTVNSKEEIIFSDKNRIRKIFNNGTITTVAGTGSPSDSLMNTPKGVCTDLSNNIIFIDWGTNRIKKISAIDGSISVVAGKLNQVGTFPADKSLANNTAITPVSIAVHPVSGELYFATMYTISKIGSDGLIYRIAGNGSIGVDNTVQAATNAMLSSIIHISIGKNSVLYMIDGFRVRQISSNVITTLLTESSTFPPKFVYHYNSYVYYTVSCQILKFPDNNPSVVTTILGLRGTCVQFFGVKRQVDMTQNYLSFDAMTAFTMSASTGRMYFSNPRRMWNITDGYIYPMVYNYGENIDIKDGLIENDASSCFDNSGNLILGDNFRLRKLNTTSHIVNSIIGNESPMVPFACTVAPNGDIYFKDNQAIKKLDASTGLTTTLDTVLADHRSRNYKIKLLPSGALIYTDLQYVIAYYNNQKTTIAGSVATGPFSGEGGRAVDVVQNAFLVGLTANSKGEIFYSDETAYIRKLTPYCSDTSTYLDSTGTKCLVSSCFGVDYNINSVCSGHGKCVSNDVCKCNDGYSGLNCEKFTCFGLNNTDPKVCSGNGTCVDIDYCSCTSGYQPECKGYVCFGYPMDNFKVCSSHGKCIGNDKCECDPTYNGTKCENYYCFGLSASDPNVCNGNGKCIETDTCSCSFGFQPNCYAHKCSGKVYNDSSVCSSSGKCVAENTCICTNGTNGPNCEFLSLLLDIQGRPTLKTVARIFTLLGNPVDNCATIFASKELSYLGNDPICKFSASGLEIILGSGFSIDNGTFLPTQSFDGWKYDFRVQAGSVCGSYAQTSLTLDFSSQTNSLQNLNSDTILRISETDYSQSFGRSISWTGPSDLVPLVSPNQKVVIIPKGYWKPGNNLPVTVSTKTSLCGTNSNSRTFTFKTDSTAPSIDIMTDTPSGKLNCVGYDCLFEFSLSPAGSYSAQIKFDGDYSLITSISSIPNLQIARLSNYYDSTTYLGVKYYGTVNLQLLFNSVIYSSTYPMQYLAYESSQLFINNLNRGFRKDQSELTFSLVSQNPLLLTVNPGALPITYNWTISSGNKIIGPFYTNSISIPNPGVGNYSLSLQVNNNDEFSETITGTFSVFDTVGAIPDVSVDSFTNPYPFIKTLDLTATVNSTTSVSQIYWNVISGSFYNSPVLSNFAFSQNNIKTSLSIPVSYLKEGSNYVFELRVTNSVGTNIQRFNVKMDYNPRFTCDYFTSYNSSQLKVYESKLIISCSSFENNMASYVVDLFDGDVKLMTLSNTAKSSVIARLPYSLNALSLNVRGINRNGSYRKVVKSITGPFLNFPSSDLSARVSYVSQQWTSVKAENIKMDTASSILSLLTYLQNGKQTFDDLSGLSDSSKQTLTTVMVEMISALKSITTIGYRADDKISAVLLSPTLRVVKLVKTILPTVYSNQKSDIQYLTSFIVKGVESVTSYYSANMVRALVDGLTFNETVSLVQNAYSSAATSGLLGQLTRLQLILKPDFSPLNSVSYQSPQEISGKTITLGASISFTFPSNFYSQISSSVPFSLISSQEQSNSDASSATVSISLFKSDGSAFKVQGLTSFIEIVFADLVFKSENVSCVYFDEVSNAWSRDGLITTLVKKQTGGFNVKCETNHLTAFSVVVNDAITPVQPTQSPAKSGTTTTTTDNTLAIVLGVVIPSVVIIAAIVTVIIVVAIVCMRKKKKGQSTNQPKLTKLDSVYEQPNISAYEHSKPHDILTDTELSVMSDFPSNNSMLIKPLMSVYTSTGSTSSTSSKFDPMSRYKNLVRIGQGGFGSVFKAEDAKCGNQLKALKVIKYSSVEELNNILKEGNRLMNISHPYILHVNDVLIDSDQILCIDMDYYEKGDLNQFVKVGSECPENILKQILYQMCNALDYVHNTLQIVHRDIKPSNIFIKEMSQDSIHLILADFGLARQTQGSVMFSYAGTPLFMSTELALGGKYTANTDIYSLGVTLYQIITKDVETSLSHISLTMDTAEFEKTIRNKMKQANPALSDELLDIIVSMLKRDYATRPYPKDILSNSYFQ